MMNRGCHGAREKRWEVTDRQCTVEVGDLTYIAILNNFGVGQNLISKTLIFPLVPDRWSQVLVLAKSMTEDPRPGVKSKGSPKLLKRQPNSHMGGAQGAKLYYSRSLGTM
jgi:hypothetical protein